MGKTLQAANRMPVRTIDPDQIVGNRTPADLGISPTRIPELFTQFRPEEELSTAVFEYLDNIYGFLARKMEMNQGAALVMVLDLDPDPAGLALLLRKQLAESILEMVDRSAGLERSAVEDFVDPESKCFLQIGLGQESNQFSKKIRDNVAKTYLAAQGSLSLACRKLPGPKSVSDRMNEVRAHIRGSRRHLSMESRSRALLASHDNGDALAPDYIAIATHVNDLVDTESKVFSILAMENLSEQANATEEPFVKWLSKVAPVWQPLAEQRLEHHQQVLELLLRGDVDRAAKFTSD